MYTFYIRHITAFLLLGTLDSTSALYLGTILNAKVINKKHNNEKRGTKQAVRRSLILQYEN